MKSIYFYVILCTLLATSACTSSAAPAHDPAVVNDFEIPHAKIEYYDISGSTASELRQSLDTLSPVDKNGYRSDARTDWYIRWYWIGFGLKWCALRSAVTATQIVVTLPRWDAPPDASDKLVTKWNAYMLALVEHEKGHVDLAVARFPDVAQAIQEAACDTADARAEAVLSELRDADLRYDHETHHGATQGAVFP